MLNVYFYLSYLPTLPTYLTLRTFETMLPSLTHYMHTGYPQLKSTLFHLLRESYLIDDGSRFCGGVRLLFIYGDSFLVRGESF